MTAAPTIDPTMVTANCQPAREAAGACCEGEVMDTAGGSLDAPGCWYGGGVPSDDALGGVLLGKTMLLDTEAVNTTLAPEMPNQSSAENAMSPGSMPEGALEL